MIYDCVVWGTPKVRQDVTALKELVIDTPTGRHVPLGQVADVYVAPTPNQITREANSRHIEGKKPGQEIEHPMAIVIMGGLVTSTLLNLLIMPALYWKFAKSKSK